MKWCPGKHCNKVVEVKTDEAIEINCQCGEVFCFRCLKTPHHPIQCSTLADWLDKIKDKGFSTHEIAKKRYDHTEQEEYSDTWVSMNSKKCPKCGIAIQKAGGCMHITCEKCGHGFCWLCMGGKETHGGGEYHIGAC